MEGRMGPGASRPLTETVRRPEAEPHFGPSVHDIFDAHRQSQAPVPDVFGRAPATPKEIIKALNGR